MTKIPRKKEGKHGVLENLQYNRKHPKRISCQIMNDSKAYHRKTI